VTECATTRLSYVLTGLISIPAGFESGPAREIRSSEFRHI